MLFLVVWGLLFPVSLGGVGAVSFCFCVVWLACGCLIRFCVFAFASINFVSSQKKNILADIFVFQHTETWWKTNPSTFSPKLGNITLKFLFLTVSGN